MEGGVWGPETLSPTHVKSGFRPEITYRNTYCFRIYFLKGVFFKKKTIILFVFNQFTAWLLLAFEVRHNFGRFVISKYRNVIFSGIGSERVYSGFSSRCFSLFRRILLLVRMLPNFVFAEKLLFRSRPKFYFVSSFAEICCFFGCCRIL